MPSVGKGACVLSPALDGWTVSAHPWRGALPIGSSGWGDSGTRVPAARCMQASLSPAPLALGWWGRDTGPLATAKRGPSPRWTVIQPQTGGSPDTRRALLSEMSQTQDTCRLISRARGLRADSRGWGRVADLGAA